MATATVEFGGYTYALGALAFAAFLVLLSLHRPSGIQGLVLWAACALSLAWTAAVAARIWAGMPGGEIIERLEVLRSAAWVVFLVAIGYAARWRGPRRLGARAGTLIVAGGLAAVAVLVFPHPGLLAQATATPAPLVGLSLAVIGIFYVEVTFRSASEEERWAIKFLVLGAGLIFAYDMFLYADAALFGVVDPVLHAARGAVQALAVPFLAVAAARSEIWKTNLTISRPVAVQSSTFLAAGAYLSLVAVVGYLLREFDEARGPVIQIVFFAGALAVLATALLSGTYRAGARIFVSKHFFQNKYDWREEWLRFMRTVTAGQATVPLQERCIKAIADIVESPGGAMWIIEGNYYREVHSWNFAIPNLTESAAGEVARFLSETQAVIDLNRAAAGAAEYKGLVVPEALKSAERAWLVVPLWHRSLIGFVVLARPRVATTLNWEDMDLLQTVGRQTASYVAEHKAVESLEDAKEFEIFNRRFAFIVHDIKNLVSQLSVLGRNMEKFGDNEAFRADVVATLRDAADKMTHLVERIHGYKSADATETCRLDQVVRDVVSTVTTFPVDVVVAPDSAGIRVAGDRYRLEAVIGHLVQNAVEAVAGDGQVRIELLRNGRFAVVDVADSGPGMTRDFVRKELFKPFKTTKKGMGIGVYQCREYAREVGGNLVAISDLGEGTTMRVTLPINEPA